VSEISRCADWHGWVVLRVGGGGGVVCGAWDRGNVTAGKESAAFAVTQDGSRSG